MMEYICKEIISDKDQLEINNFIHYCSITDNYAYDFQYETEILSIPSMYLCYINNKIAGLLSVCEYSSDTLCIYSLISPRFRNKHIFNTLLDMLYKNLDKTNTLYKYLECHLPCIDTSFFNSAIYLLKKNNFEFSHEEYLLSYNLSENTHLKRASNNPQTNSSDIEAIFDDSINEFTLWIDNNCIGGCMIYFPEDNNNSYATIFDYEIVSKHRGKGFGKKGLYLILKELQDMDFKNVILHVSGLNKKAHNLYISCGFDIKSLIRIYTKEI